MREGVRDPGAVVAARPWVLSPRQARWIPIAKALLLAAVGGHLFAGATAKLWDAWWTSDNISYGPLVPLVAAVFAWRRRTELRAVPLQPSPWAVAAAAAAVGAHHLGGLGNVLGLQALALPIYVTAILLAVWGVAACRVLGFPLLFLFFVVPVPATFWDRVAYPLQVFAAHFAAVTLDRAGIPVLIDGILIRLPHLTLKVAVACAGLRSLINLILVGLTLGFWTQRTTARSLCIAGLALPVAILANAMRVALTGILGHHFGQGTAEGFFHNFSGMLMFWLSAGTILGCAVVLRRVKP